MYLRVERLAIRTFVPAVILGAALVAMNGCAAGAQQQRIGKTYLEAGDYDRAVQAAKQAVDKDPQNPEYLDLLSDAQTAAADHHYEQARKALDDHRAGQAVQELDKALEYMPAHPGANTLRVTADKSVRRCRDLTIMAKEAVGREDWEQAARLARDACQADRGDAAAQELFNHARSALVSRNLAQAQVALDAGDSQACLAACTKARQWDESNPYLAQLERKAKDMPTRTEAAASPAAPATPQTRPADIASVLIKSPAVEPAQPKPEAAPQPVVAKAEPTPAPATVSPEPVAAAAPKAENAASAAPTHEDAPVASDTSEHQPLRPKDHDGARVPPRLARAAQEQERLIEAQPVASARNGQAAKQPSNAAAKAPAAKLITVEGNPAAQTPPAADPLPGAKISVTPGKPGERAKITSVSLARPATQPAGQVSAEARPFPGQITDARPQLQAQQARSEQVRTEQRIPALAAEPMAIPAPQRSAVPAPKPEPQHLFRGALSRDDDRFKKQITVVDGISIKLKDTDEDPLDADFEIVVGKSKLKPDDVPPGGKIEIKGASGHKYVMTLMWIDHDQETVHFSLDRVD